MVSGQTQGPAPADHPPWDKPGHAICFKKTSPPLFSEVIIPQVYFVDQKHALPQVVLNKVALLPHTPQDPGPSSGRSPPGKSPAMPQASTHDPRPRSRQRLPHFVCRTGSVPAFCGIYRHTDIPRPRHPRAHVQTLHLEARWKFRHRTQAKQQGGAPTESTFLKTKWGPSVPKFPGRATRATYRATPPRPVLSARGTAGTFQNI